MIVMPTPHAVTAATEAAMPTGVDDVGGAVTAARGDATDRRLRQAPAARHSVTSGHELRDDLPQPELLDLEVRGGRGGGDGRRRRAREVPQQVAAADPRADRRAAREAGGPA